MKTLYFIILVVFSIIPLILSELSLCEATCHSVASICQETSKGIISKFTFNFYDGEALASHCKSPLNTCLSIC